MIDYQISIVDAASHLIDVELYIAAPDPAGQILRLPNWIPGSYMIRDFSRNVVTITAESNSQAVALKKLDKSSWQAPGGLEQLRVCYRVYAWELSVRAAHVDCTHAFFNGTSVFLEVLGQSHVEHRVCITRPSHDTAKHFNVSTTLKALQVDDSGYGEYSATNYDELIDHPVEQGAFKQLTFSACGVTHDVVFTGECYFDEQRVCEDLAQICEYQIQLFGQPAPIAHYAFLVMVTDKGYGGLEHRASTALMISRDHLPVPGETTRDAKYIEFLGLCSHEYFHTWNVKRIKPAQFTPYQLNTESYTELLWFFEGITSYYDDLVLVRTRLIDEKQYLGLLSKTLTRVARGAGRLSQTITSSSFDAWHKFYKQDENAPNAIVSYYAKGSLVALCLDAILRKESACSISLDDLMRKIWQQWLKDGKGLLEQEPQEIVSTLVDADWSSFFSASLYTTKELPVEDCLRSLGVGLSWCERLNSQDAGGWRSETEVNEKSTQDSQQELNGEVNVASGLSASHTERNQPWLGANYVDAPGGVRLTHVMINSPANNAGLAAGDIIVAINQLAITQTAVDSVLRRYRSLGTVLVHYFRLGVLMETRLVIESAPQDTAVLRIADRETLNQWLFDSRLA